VVPRTLRVAAMSELQSFAAEVAGHSVIEDAWAGRVPPRWVTKACGLCEHEQGVRIPFVRHLCVSCGGTWTPGRCATCHTTSIVFRSDLATEFATRCFCGGSLSPVLMIPRPRASTGARTTPASSTSATEGRHVAPPPRWRRRAVVVARVAAVTCAVAGVAVGVVTVRAEQPANKPATLPAQPAAAVVDDGTVHGLGARAGHELIASGHPVNPFACESAYLKSVAPNALDSSPVTTSGQTGQATQSDQTSVAQKDFLAGCLAAGVR